jgi:hypothetical protein
MRARCLAIAVMSACPPKADKLEEVSLSPLSADFVVKVADEDGQDWQTGFRGSTVLYPSACSGRSGGRAANGQATAAPPRRGPGQDG